MLYIELNEVGGEGIIKVPLVRANFELVNPGGSFVAKYPITLYETYEITDYWIPQIPIENLQINNALTKHYENKKNNFVLELKYYRQQSQQYDTNYVAVEIRMLKNKTIYFGSANTFYYPYSHGGIINYASILFYDPNHKTFGHFTGGKFHVNNIKYKEGQELITGSDNQYYKDYYDLIGIIKGKYNSPLNYYFKGEVNPTPKNIVLKYSDNGAIGYSPFQKWSVFGIGYDNEAAYDAFFENILVPSYPNNPDDPENPDDDPTDPIPGESDPTSDPIPIPPKPTTDVTGTGFVTLYNPNAIDIRNLAYFMWSGEFTDLIKKMFSAPFDCIIGLKLIYCPLTTGNNQTIWLGNVESNVSAPKITEQFIDFDCGTITLNGYYGSFLDYPPYTKISIFLPFIGYKQLNVDEVMNSIIHLVYRIDVYTGACIAFLQITKTILSTQLNSVLYQFDGNCAMDIPFTSNDMSRYIGAILNTAASTAMTLTTPNTGANEKQQNNINTKISHNATSGIVNGALDVIQTKPTIARGGSLAGANASMGIKQPYIIIERPLQQMPNDYQNYIGIPLNMTKQLSQIKGFTVLSKIFMASQTATENEIQMIENLLYEGVVF